MRATPGFLAVGGLLLRAALLAQAPPAVEAPEVFGESLEVALVEIEVRVAGRDGKPVTGLTAGDFELVVNGKLVEPALFSEIAHAVEAPAGPATTDAAVEPRRWIGLYLDLPTIEQPDLARLRPWLDQVASAGDVRLALGVYRGPGSLHIVEATRESLPAQLDQLTRGGAASAAAVRELRFVMSQIALARRPEEQPTQREAEIAAAEAETAWYAIASYGMQVEQDYRHALDSAELFLGRLAGLPGPKVMLYIGGGRSLRPAEAPIRAWEEKFAELNRQRRIVSTLDASRWDLGPLTEKLGARAARYGVAVSTLAVGAVSLGASAAADSGDPLFDIARVSEQSSRSFSLELLAEPSGGRSFTEPSAAVLDSLRADLAHNYVLGFTPPPGKKSEYEVAVRARDRSLGVRHRRVAAARSRHDRMVDRTLAALAFGRAENELEVRLDRAGVPERSRGRAVELPVVVTVPMSRLALVPRGAQHVGQLSLFLAAADEDGAVSTVTEVRLPLRVANDQLSAALGQLATYRTRLGLKGGTPLIAATVVDDLGGAVATALLRLDADAWAGIE